MGIVYLCEQGALIKRRGRRLIVEKAGVVLLDEPVIKIDCVNIFGNIQVSTQALAMLMENNADVAFFTMRGRLRGMLNSCLSKNIFQRIAQHDRWHDTGFRLMICKSLVSAKIGNMIGVLRRYWHNHQDCDFNPVIARLETGIKTLQDKVDPQGCMGVEGSCSGIYFKAYATMFRRELRFPGRKMHPSPDPVNALLSLGYVLVTNEIAALLEGASLDPYLGFLHGIKYGRKSLALDLVEQFRQPLIDQFILNLVNRRVFVADDFELSPGAGVYLKDAPFKRYFEQYEARLSSLAPMTQEPSLAWRDLMRRQVENLKRSIMEGSEYQAYSAG